MNERVQENSADQGVMRMEHLAQFGVDTRSEDLPTALVAQAKRHILCTFGGPCAETGRYRWLRLRLEVDPQLSEDGEPVR